MLFVTNSVQRVKWMPYQGSSGRVWRLQNRRADFFTLWNMQMTLCYWLRKKWCYRTWLIN